MRFIPFEESGKIPMEIIFAERLQNEILKAVRGNGILIDGLGGGGKDRSGGRDGFAEEGDELIRRDIG